nr:hypothetical protein [Tanacetum cinerariifolium]
MAFVLYRNGQGVMLQGNHEIKHVEDEVPLTEHLTRKRNNKTDEAGESSSVTVDEELNPSPTLVVALNVIPLIIRRRHVVSSMMDTAYSFSEH